MANPRLQDGLNPPYRHPNDSQRHYGIVSVTGQATIDLKIRHNNFIVTSLLIKGALSAISDGVTAAWDYGSQPGTFVITLTKQDASFGPLILATVAKSVSFEVLAGNSVSLY